METANKHFVKIYYTTDNAPFDDYYSYEVDGRNMREPWFDIIVGEIAEVYYSCNDGWERSDWDAGVPFTIWRDNGDRVGDFVVTMEPNPVFSAYSVEPDNA
jgi:hypothetical protein